MTSPIRKINSIKNMAVYKDFQWPLSVRDRGNNIAEFKNINIIYGRNYSGKTTLSRIIRAAETGTLSDKYTNPEFNLTFEDESSVSQVSLNSHSHLIRVFNEDFVKDNLRFIIDDEQQIDSFAILGEDNSELEEKIEEQETELGNEEEKTGLVGKLIDATKKHDDTKKEYSAKSSELEDMLRDKANKERTGIKHNTVFGDANYNITRIKKDVTVVTKSSYSAINDEDAISHQNLLKEQPKKEISESTPFNLQYSTIAIKAKELIEKKILASNPIQELLSDTALAAWVKTGRDHHKDKRDKCSFCGNNLPEDLWDKLDKHFNQESEELSSALERLLESIKREKKRIPNLLKIKASDFYSNFTESLDELAQQLAIHSDNYLASLEATEKQIEARMADIFTTQVFEEPISAASNLDKITTSYEQFRQQSNESTTTLSTKQSKARTALRLHEVYKFISDIKYSDKCQVIANLKTNVDEAEKCKTLAQGNVNNKRVKINELKAQLKDESKGADRVNDYLNNFFGHHSLSLKAIEEAAGEGPTGYRFEVIRNDEKAFHLSEGECSLIAFCYFMAKLDDIETKGNQPIIWIDDPISSLDDNHIFFVYSIINTQIITPEKYEEDGEIKERLRFKQLFISTHNLGFLKYLKRLPGALNNRKSQYFIINRTDQSSDILLMPKYLKEYVTEFNFLFHQIYKCAAITSIDDDNYTTFYNFGNNARKFFEIYLYYKYPNQGMAQETLQLFFGEQSIPAILTDRINNEYSHLAGVFERGSTPVEVPEMHTSAMAILEKLKENDIHQYNSLIQSVGESSID